MTTPAYDGETLEGLPAGTVVGRYRVDGLLGAGGMGAVYRGWDPELRRRVALKRVHPERASKPEAVRRLRREARAVARINHPAITQIFDVLSSDGTLWIVLELVDGESIRELHERQPVPLAELLDGFLQITRGLKAAHDQGILHRDLKHENVLVTPEGQVKILDFGLAKALDLERLDSRGESTLTRPGRFLGTCRAMSPEQVLGEKLDARSDLFALGVLIYETLAGTSPFRGKSSVETLRRVLWHRPPSLKETCPSVSAELSDLVDRLLAKDPGGRPRDGGEVAAILEKLSAPERAIPEERRFSELSGGETPAGPAGRRRGFHLGWVVALAMTVLLAVASVPDDPSFDEFAPASGVIPAEDFDALVSARARLQSARGLDDLRELEDDLRALERRSPRLMETHLLRSRVLRRIFALTRDAEVLERAFGAAARARSLDPRSSLPILAELEATLESRSLERAGQLLRDLDRRIPGSPRVAALRAWWLRLQGRAEEAVDILRRLEMFQASPENLYELAFLELSLADFGAARRHLEQLLHWFPGHHTGRALLAQTEMLDGRLERAAELYESLLERQDDLASRSNLGLVHLLRGQPEKALPLFRRAAQAAPKNAALRLNLADALRWTGRPAEAKVEYAATVRRIEEDPGGDDWNRFTVLAQALVQLGERERALAALDRARAASDRKEVALEAAIVFAELGDDRRALEELRSALAQDGGLSRVWLSLPSFARLRSTFEG